MRIIVQGITSAEPKGIPWNVFEPYTDLHIVEATEMPEIQHIHQNHLGLDVSEAGVKICDPLFWNWYGMLK